MQIGQDYVGLTSRLAALDVVFAELRGEFGGEDVVDPDVRELIESMRAEVGRLVEEMARYVGKVEVPGPDATTVERLRTLAHEG